MSNDSETRVQRHIQARGPNRLADPVLTDECLALCELLDGMGRELVALRKRVFQIETGGDCA